MSKRVLFGLLVVVLVLVSVAFPAVARSPMSAVTLAPHTEGPTFLAGQFDVVLRVANTGADALSSVAVNAQHDCFGDVGPPIELSGNGDAILDPSEEWEYRCTTPNALLGATGFTFSATDPSDQPFTASTNLFYELASPLTVSVLPSSSVVHAGEEVVWTGIVSNISNFGIVINSISHESGCAPAVPSSGPVGQGLDWSFTCTAIVNASTEYSGVVVWAPAGSPGTSIGGPDTSFSSAVAVTSPEITVEITEPDGVFSGAIFTVDFTITNIGSDVLTGIEFEPTDACGPSAGITVRQEAIGNGDEVFEPGEVWAYHAPRCLTWAIDWIGAEVDFVDSLGTAHGVRAGVQYKVLPPLTALPVGDLTFASDSTQPVRVTVRNHSDIRVRPTSNNGTAELWITAVGGPGTVFEVGELVEVSGNGDDTVDPGEEWRADFDVDVGTGPWGPDFLDIRLSGWNPDEDIPADSGDRFGWPWQRIGTIAVAAPATSSSAAPATTVTPTLPVTGGGDTPSAIAGAVAIVVGVLLVTMTHRLRRGSHPVQQ